MKIWDTSLETYFPPTISLFFLNIFGESIQMFMCIYLYYILYIFIL